MSDSAPISRMRKAHQALASSRTLLRAGDPEGACNRAYYAMFYAAHAALDGAGAIPPGTLLKTHNGLITIFSKELVLTAKVEERLGRAFSKVYDVRLLADYEGKQVEAGRANWAIDQADDFVSAIAAKFFA